MLDLKEFYILGLPIQTVLGSCHFLKVKEYPEYFFDLQTVSLTKSHLINKYSEINKKIKDPQLEEFITSIHNLNLYTLANTIPELSESYLKLFAKVFNNEDAFSNIKEEDFDYIRNLIMEMNFMKEEVINPNPEIQKAIERSRRVKTQGDDKLEFTDIISSVVGFNGLSYQNINEFTIYQLYMTFYRIAQIKNYDTSTLFATVASEKIKIESWSKHIGLNGEDEHSMSKDEFEKQSNDLFDS